MFSLRTGLAVIAAGGVITYFAAGGSRTEVEFTRPAPAPLAALDIRPIQSAAFVTVPVELSGIGARAAHALPAEFPEIKSWLPDAACARRTRWVECNTAKLEGKIEPAGALDIRIEDHTATARIPVSYDLSATGIGWARSVSEHKTGKAYVSQAFDIRFEPTAGFTVTRHKAVEDEGGEIGLLKAKLRLSALLAKPLEPMAKAIETELTAALARVPVSQAVTQAWSALSRPLELGAGSGSWLKSVPEFVSPSGFITSGGQSAYKLAIVTRMSIVEMDAKAAAGPSRIQAQPLYGVLNRAPALSRIRIAVPVGLATMQQATANAFAEAGQFQTRADRFAKPVKIKVEATRVYPAARQIAVELALAVTPQSGDTVYGKAHLAGRPVIDLATGTVTVTDVTFPLTSARELPNRHQNGTVPRLGTEPFAGIFTKAARLDISRAAGDALPRTRYLLNQRLGGRMTLSADLTRASPVSFELANDGAWLIVDVEGQVEFGYDSRGIMSTTPVARTTPAASSKVAAAKPIGDPIEKTTPTGQATTAASTTTATAPRDASPAVDRHVLSRHEPLIQQRVSAVAPVSSVRSAAPRPATAPVSTTSPITSTTDTTDQRQPRPAAKIKSQTKPTVKSQAKAQSQTAPRPAQPAANRGWVAETFNRS